MENILLQLAEQVPILLAVLGFLWYVFKEVNKTLNQIVKTHDEADTRMSNSIADLAKHTKLLTMTVLHGIDDKSMIKDYVVSTLAEDEIKKGLQRE